MVVCFDGGFGWVLMHLVDGIWDWELRVRCALVMWLPFVRRGMQ